MKDLKSLLSQIKNERFVHQISELTYDHIFTLWHLNPKIERQLSGVVSKVVIGLFLLRYLSHLNHEVMKEANVKNRLTSKDLSDKKKIEKAVKKLGKSDKLKTLLEKEIFPQLIDILENTKAKNLADLTRLAHAGDYLSSALDDLKSVEDPEYRLWLESVPEYYDKDLTHLSLKRGPVTISKGKTRSFALDRWVTNLNKHTPSIEAVFAGDRTFSVRSQIRERRRPLLGFNRWVEEKTRLVEAT